MGSTLENEDHIQDKESTAAEPSTNQTYFDSISPEPPLYTPDGYTELSYQREIKNSVIQAMRQGDRTIYVDAPTGSGKTTMVVDLLMQYPKKALIVVPSSAALSRFLNEYQKRTGQPKKVRRLSSSNIKNLDQIDVAITTVQFLTTANKKGERYIDAIDDNIFGICVFDEGHKYFGEIHGLAGEKFKGTPQIYLTATGQTKKNDLRNKVDHVVSYTYSQLVKDHGFPVRRDVAHSVESEDYGQIKVVAGKTIYVDEKDGNIRGLNMPQRYLVAIKILKEICLPKKEAAILFFPTNATAKWFHDKILPQFPELNNLALRVCPKTKDLGAVSESINSGEVLFVSNAERLEESFDAPALTHAIDLTNISVFWKREQRRGRVSRRFQGKTSCFYHYASGNSANETRSTPSEIADIAQKQRRTLKSGDRVISKPGMDLTDLDAPIPKDINQMVEQLNLTSKVLTLAEIYWQYDMSFLRDSPSFCVDALKVFAVSFGLSAGRAIELLWTPDVFKQRKELIEIDMSNQGQESIYANFAEFYEMLEFYNRVDIVADALTEDIDAITETVRNEIQELIPGMLDAAESHHVMGRLPGPLTLLRADGSDVCILRKQTKIATLLMEEGRIKWADGGVQVLGDNTETSCGPVNRPNDDELTRYQQYASAASHDDTPGKTKFRFRLGETAEPFLAGGYVICMAGYGKEVFMWLEKGVAPENIIILENNPENASVLRRRFPGVTVIEGDIRKKALWDKMKAHCSPKKGIDVISIDPNGGISLRFNNYLTSFIEGLSPGKNGLFLSINFHARGTSRVMEGITGISNEGLSNSAYHERALEHIIKQYAHAAESTAEDIRTDHYQGDSKSHHVNVMGHFPLNDRFKTPNTSEVCEDTLYVSTEAYLDDLVSRSKKHLRGGCVLILGGRQQEYEIQQWMAAGVDAKKILVLAEKSYGDSQENYSRIMESIIRDTAQNDTIDVISMTRDSAINKDLKNSVERILESILAHSNPVVAISFSNTGTLKTYDGFDGMGDFSPSKRRMMHLDRMVQSVPNFDRGKYQSRSGYFQSTALKCVFSIHEPTIEAVKGSVGEISHEINHPTSDSFFDDLVARSKEHLTGGYVLILGVESEHQVSRWIDAGVPASKIIIFINPRHERHSLAVSYPELKIISGDLHDPQAFQALKTEIGTGQIDVISLNSFRSLRSKSRLLAERFIDEVLSVSTPVVSLSFDATGNLGAYNEQPGDKKIQPAKKRRVILLDRTTRVSDHFKASDYDLESGYYLRNDFHKYVYCTYLPKKTVSAPVTSGNEDTSKPYFIHPMLQRAHELIDVKFRGHDDSVQRFTWNELGINLQQMEGVLGGDWARLIQANFATAGFDLTSPLSDQRHLSASPVRLKSDRIDFVFINGLGGKHKCRENKWVGAMEYNKGQEARPFGTLSSLTFTERDFDLMQKLQWATAFELNPGLLGSLDQFHAFIGKFGTPLIRKKGNDQFSVQFSPQVYAIASISFDSPWGTNCQGTICAHPIGRTKDTFKAEVRRREQLLSIKDVTHGIRAGQIERILAASPHHGKGRTTRVVPVFARRPIKPKIVIVKARMDENPKPRFLEEEQYNYPGWTLK